MIVNLSWQLPRVGEERVSTPSPVSPTVRTKVPKAPPSKETARGPTTWMGPSVVSSTGSKTVGIRFPRSSRHSRCTSVMS